MTQANKNNLLYTSREFDFETNQIYYKISYYNVQLGQLIGVNLKYFKNSIEVYIYFSQYTIDSVKKIKIFPFNRGIIVKDKRSHDDYTNFVECCAGGCNTQSRCQTCGAHWSVVCYGWFFGWGLWCEAWCLP